MLVALLQLLIELIRDKISPLKNEHQELLMQIKHSHGRLNSLQPDRYSKYHI